MHTLLPFGSYATTPVLVEVRDVAVTADVPLFRRTTRHRYRNRGRGLLFWKPCKRIAPEVFDELKSDYSHPFPPTHSFSNAFRTAWYGFVVELQLKWKHVTTV